MLHRRQTVPPAGNGGLTENGAVDRPDTADGYRVLIFSASMGAGHDGAARELAARLRASGHHAEVLDFLDAGPLRVGRALRSGYEFELKHVPSAYDATYRFWHRVPWLCPLVAWFVCLLTRRRVRRHVRRAGADVVVSTYPLATLCLGRLRRKGKLAVPAVNFITDFGVHPLWVDPGIDLNLAVHDAPARMAEARTGQPSRACGPVVSEAFWPDRQPDVAARTEQRARLGLSPADAAVLVVAGSWGVGGIDHTLQAVAAGGAFVPVVVCGQDPALRARVQALADASGWRATVLGWTDQMPALMGACDALVENAGGLTSLEALRAGLPVVSFRPIAGHGKENTAAMADAGVAHLATTPDELVSALDLLSRPGPARDAQIAAGAAMFREDPSALIARTAAFPPPALVTARPPGLVAARAFASAGVVLALIWAGLTTGVGVAAASGAGVAHPTAHVGRVAYVGVRLDAVELANPQVQAELIALHATAVVDQATATAASPTLLLLAARGVNIASGGRGANDARAEPQDTPALWTRAEHDVAASAQLSAIVGQPVREFVPGRRVNVFDLLDCHKAHNSLIVPNATFGAADPDTNTGLTLQARHVYLVNGMDATSAQVLAVLQEVEASLGTSNLATASLAALH